MLRKQKGDGVFYSCFSVVDCCVYKLQVQSKGR